MTIAMDIRKTIKRKQTKQKSKPKDLWRPIKKKIYE